MFISVLPNTEDRAKRLKALFKKPLLCNKNVKKKLSDIFCEEFVFYEIDDLREEHGSGFDIRNFIKGYIKAILYDLENCPEDILVPFDKKAIEILKSIN